MSQHDGSEFALGAHSESGPRLAQRPLPKRVERVLILDRKAVMATEMARIMAGLGYEVDVLGGSGSPAFHSRYVHRPMVVPPVEERGAFLRIVGEVVASGDYDAIFVCNEEVLEALLGLVQEGQCNGLVLSAMERVKTALSRKAMLELARAAGVFTPRTIVPQDAGELKPAAAELGFPLIVKGDRGEAGNHVRLVREPSELAAAYEEIAILERASDPHPMLQEYVQGPAFSVGGLFDRGRPLRVCAHLKLVGVPPLGGLTAKGITIRHPVLLGETFKIFEALEYRGLGHAEFIRDRLGRFRFLEVNPRVWGTIAISHYAGVDLFSPYLDLAKGLRVEPDLRYREGLRFHRLLREVRLVQRRPRSVWRVLRDCCDPRVYSDFQWSDARPHLAALGEWSRQWLRQRSAGQRIRAAIN